MFEVAFDFFIKTLIELGFRKVFIINQTKHYLDKWSNDEYDPYDGKRKQRLMH